MATIRVDDGCELYLSESGQGSPLVFVHGTGANADAWNAVIAEFARTHRTIAYDRRGYQRSIGPPAPAKGYYKKHGEDLSRLLREIDAAPAIVIAWSAGGFVALHAALMNPERISQLVLYEPPLHAKANISWPLLKTFLQVAFHRATARPEAAATAFRRMVLSYSDGRSTLDTLSPEARKIMAQETPGLLAELAAGTGEELEPAALQRIRVPIKLLRGELSPQLFQSATGRLRAILPDAPVFSIPGANHFAQLDHPDRFISALRSAIAA